MPDHVIIFISIECWLLQMNFFLKVVIVKILRIAWAAASGDISKVECL